MPTEITRNGTKRVVIDSSGWLEYITADSKAALFARYFESDASILVPALVLYEVRKILLLRQSKTLADVFVSEALRKEIIAIDERIALDAAALSIQYQLPMADALLYACAESRGAEFVTSDAHFRGLPDVTLL
jgi:toxin FitB